MYSYFDEYTFQKQYVFEIKSFCNIIHLFTIFDQFNASL